MKKFIKGTGQKYQVSDDGAIFGPRGRLKPTLMKLGYYSVSISVETKVTKHYVHKLVAETFMGLVPKGHVVNHINSDKLDNRLKNLEIISRESNSKHWVASGRRVNPKSGLNAEVCDFGHLYSFTTTGLKYCKVCRRMTPAEKLACQGINLSDFRILIDADNYMIANDGRVLSLKTHRILKQGTNLPGYKYVSIKMNDGSRKNKAIHRLVYQNFLGDIPANLQVDHINGNKLDNHITNLRLLSPSENMVKNQDRRRQKNFGFKFDEEYISFAKWILQKKFYSNIKSAQLLGMSETLARNIAKENQWAHVLASEPPTNFLEKFHSGLLVKSKLDTI